MNPEAAGSSSTEPKSNAAPQSGKTLRAAHHIRLLVLTIVLLAAALRLYDLERTSLWSDEATSLSQARLSFWNMIVWTAHDNYPPLHNFILFIVIRLFGDSETSLRLPSALFGIANVYLLYLLGSALWDRRTGLLAAALLAISGFAAWYSQEARMYALLGLASTAYMLSVLMLLAQPGRWRMALCVAAGTAMLYSHPYGTFLWIAINVAIPLGAHLRPDWPRIDWRRWLLSQGLTGVMFLPWLLVLIYRLHLMTRGFWIAYPTPTKLLAVFDSLAGGRPAFIGFAALIPLSFVRLEAFRGKRPASPAPADRAGRIAMLDTGWRQFLLLTWLLAPLLIGYFISVAASPILLDRYLICSLPAMMLLSARGLRRLAINRIVFACAVLAAVAWSLPQLYDSLAVRERDDFRSAAAVVTRDYRSGDHIICYWGYTAPAFLYYFRGPPPYVTGVRVAEATAMNIADGERVWIVITKDSHGDGMEILEKMGPAHVQAARYDFAFVKVFLFVPKSG